MTLKLQMLTALLDAIGKMLAAIAAINADDLDTAEAELEAVHEILQQSAKELRAA